MDLKIGICGIGFVGGAIMNSLINKGFIYGHNLIAYDKYKSYDNFDALLDTNILFLALPTPFDNQNKEYNKKTIDDTLDLLHKNNYSGLITIKSTVEPTTTKKYISKYNLNIIHNPEFLSSRTATEDFNNQKHIIIGKESNNINILLDFYKKYFPDAEISICTTVESESVKLFANNFYALKVQFFTELYLLCGKMNADYNNIKKMMIKNGWISPFHTDVPGHDGQVSYGGLCFPKDTNALLYFMKNQDCPFGLIDALIKERDSIRKD
jgi:UDPglucose 6-dehydrogenase